MCPRFVDEYGCVVWGIGIGERQVDQALVCAWRSSVQRRLYSSLESYLPRTNCCLTLYSSDESIVAGICVCRGGAWRRASMGAFPFRTVSVLIWVGVIIVPKTHFFVEKRREKETCCTNFCTFQNKT